MITSKFFNMGIVVLTKEIDEAIKKNRKFALEVNLSLRRYAVRDWGNINAEDKQANNKALDYPDDLYILAAYETCKGKIYINTRGISKKTGDNATIVYFK